MDNLVTMVDVVGDVKHRRSKIIMYKKPVLLFVLVFLMIGAGFVIYKMKYQKLDLKTVVCDDRQVSEAVPFLVYENNQQLNPIAERIRAEKGYEQDPNCMYIVLMNSINSLSLKKSQDDLNQLEKVYDPKAGFSKAFRLRSKTMEELRQLVAFIEKKNKEYDTNAKLFSQPE